MSPAWCKPEFQPNPEAPVEFELKPLTVEQTYEARVTCHENGTLRRDISSLVFTRNVASWKGIEAPCSQENRLAITRADEKIFGHAVGTWVVWLLEIGSHLVRQAMMTESERKNS